MRRRLAKSVAEVEHESNKMARAANRASPLMETLGGFTIALASIYGGYRVIETGATPGEFVSFMAAFLLAYEPAKRLARLNIDLNNNLVGVRVLYEIIGRAERRCAAAAQAHEGAPRIRRCAFRLSSRHAGAARHELRRPTGQAHRASGALGRRQINGAQPHPALLRG
jgi:ABC-type multidrug transport system fused ATPase/permease subunit